jgi:hypothetical protein
LSEPLRVLVEHRVDDVDERLVAIEEPVPAGQQVALEPALTLMLGKDLDDAPFRGLVLVRRQPLGHPLPVGDLENEGEAVRLGLVRPEDAETRGVVADDVPEPGAGNAGGLAEGRARSRHLDRVVPKVGDGEVAEQLAAVRMRVRAHAARAPWGKLGQLRHQAPTLVEELLGAVAPQPVLEDAKVVAVIADVGDRHLVRAPRALDR